MHKINNRLNTLLPEKVAGTSFYKQNIDTFGLNPYQAIPEKTFEAFVTPEPDNAYDPNAKRVDIMVPTGVKGENMIYKIGYLKKDGAMYRATKANTKTLIWAQVTLTAWSKQTKKDGNPAGLNDSYSIYFLGAKD